VVKEKGKPHNNVLTGRYYDQPARLLPFSHVFSFNGSARNVTYHHPFPVNLIHRVSSKKVSCYPVIAKLGSACRYICPSSIKL